MAEFDAFRDLTDAERKNLLSVQRDNHRGATRAGYEGKEKVQDLIQHYERQARDRAVEGGHTNENEGGRSR